MFGVTKIVGFVETSPFPAWLASGRGECLYVNPTLERLAGLKADQINQVDWRSFVLEEDRAAASWSWQRSLASGVPYRTTVRLRGSDGVPATVELIAFGHTLDDGTELWLFTGLPAHGTTQQYPRLEAQLQATLNVIPAYTWYALASGALTFVNSRTGDYLGLPRDHPLRFGIETGAEWDAHISLLHPDDQEEARRVWSVCLGTGSAGENSQRIRSAKGVYRWFISRVEPLRASDGTLLYWIGVNLDIDDRKRAEEMARQSERELRAIIETIPAHIHSARPDGYYDFFNATWLEYVGLPLEDLLGWKWTAAIHPADVEGLVEAWRRCLAMGEELAYEARVRRADGEFRWMFHRKAPHRDERGDIVKWFGSSIDIEEIKRTEAKLKKSEAYLSEAQRLSQTGSFGWNPDTGEIVWSDEAYRIFEYDSTLKPTLDSVVQRVHPDDRVLVKQVIDRASQTSTGFEHEYRLLLSEGRVKHVHAIAHALRDSSGNREFIGAATDVTERKQAEELLVKSAQELQRSEFYLTEAQRLGHIGNWVFDPARGFDYWSDELFRIYGLDPGNGPPSSEQYLAAVHPQDREFMASLMKRMLSDDLGFDVTKRIVRASGEVRYVRCVGTVDSGNNPSKIIGVGIDVTDHEVLTHELRRREAYLAEAQRLSHTGSFGWKPGIGELVCSEETCRIYEYDQNERVTFDRMIERVHPKDRALVLETAGRASCTGAAIDFTYRLLFDDGRVKHLHVLAKLLRSDCDEPEFAGAVTDITEHKTAEDHLRDTRMKLAKASRLATIAELAGSIAHELNQPLMSILANAQAAKRWLNAAPSNVMEAKSSIDRVIRDARGADETMQHIRALFKQESFDKKDINISDILSEVVRIVQEDPKKRFVPIECRFEEFLPVVQVDQIQIQQVFINLIVNAIEALEEQQVVPLVVLRATIGSNEILIQVIDNGPGVDDADRIFDAFMTTKENGMGIGLAVSRTIIEAHGGRLWAENNETGGATFNVALPLSHARPTTT